MDNPVLFFRATGALSTEKWNRPKLLSASAQIHTESRTWFFVAQVLVNIEKNTVVHKNRLALLLLLFFNNTIKEQLINIQNTPAAGLWKLDVLCPLQPWLRDIGVHRATAFGVWRRWARVAPITCRTIRMPQRERQSSRGAQGDGRSSRDFCTGLHAIKDLPPVRGWT
ncbi:hypothetical protein ACDW_00720 [Acidovorax sp. DW039]|uniref:hypothetical protein n=1 Tax=Acidovorax sp. DW039 TaxID=3095606 RepID=UPI0030895C14|nr:hypothetical protein ACDW_00720 [Acidovorax sp. DW039]